MKRLGNCVMALLFGCCMPLLIWAGMGVALYQGEERRKSLKPGTSEFGMLC